MDLYINIYIYICMRFLCDMSDMYILKTKNQCRSFGCSPWPGQSAHGRVLKALCNESREKLGEFEA